MIKLFDVTTHQAFALFENSLSVSYVQKLRPSPVPEYPNPKFVKNVLYL